MQLRWLFLHLGNNGEVVEKLQYRCIENFCNLSEPNERESWGLWQDVPSISLAAAADGN